MLSFGRRKSARAGIRAALLAGATVAAVGLGAVGSASAAPLCSGSNITGEGSSLQKEAEINIWKPGFETSICPGGPTISYLPEGSGAGLAAWNFDNVSKTINTARQFIGTDDAPNPTQIKNARSVTTGGTKTGASVLTIPITQTAISIVAHPPAGCTVTSIENVDLQKVFEGTLLSWKELATATGGAACEFPITRVVRFDSSGTTYQFKNYLAKINGKGILPCTGGKLWKELEETGTPNTTWPKNSEGCESPTLSPVVTAGVKGGGALVEKVNGKRPGEIEAEGEGRIGYAALPDAKAKNAKVILNLQNNGKTTKSPLYATPGSGQLANCQSTVYTVPKAGRRIEGTGLNANWSKVFGAKLSTVKSGGGYSLCTLTYALAWNGYQKAGFTPENEATVNDYLREYITAEAGQEAIATAINKWYAPLPENETEPKHDVLGAAQLAASNISY
jgi:ABC-type phosphate transport system substrate-binding protein